ncbi:phage tail assembly chaperone [Methyloceanibacter methanicus]
MEAGLGALRLSPCDFWAMTPRELDAALKGAFGPRARYPSPCRAVTWPR